MSAELLSDDMLISPSHPAHLLRQYSLNIPRSGSHLLHQKAALNSARNWHNFHKKWRTPPDAVFDAATIYHDYVVEAIFGEGVLGIEFAIDDSTGRVVIKSTPANVPSTLPSSSRHFKSQSSTQVVVGDQLRPGLAVDGINDQQVTGLRGDEVLHLLASTPRPMYVSFVACTSNMVVCRLCECRMEASQLDEHTELCVFSKKHEQEASQVNSMLSRIADVLESNMRTQDMLSYFSASDIAFYQTMRSIAQQVQSYLALMRLINLIGRRRRATLRVSTRSNCVFA
ncbi:hypothetical protein DYB32_003379 [Aphanomyces invadans]|uniref:PDZ domain-containing protein n=1 Tax=Aphanomyces invadans TaxID=157072 RepID=A0A3R6VDC3_9STRA|nr:hypothetical protein DYB32_003379 [Aphanomyces invadans]